jgi:hypothetical protein
VESKERETVNKKCVFLKACIYKGIKKCFKRCKQFISESFEIEQKGRNDGAVNS